MRRMVSKRSEGRGRADRSEVSLKETPSASYLQRTEWNVGDSDATVLFSFEAKLTGGSKKTVEFALEHNKPWLHLWEHKRRGGWIFLRLQRKVFKR
jgi:hypothetical protein